MRVGLSAALVAIVTVLPLRATATGPANPPTAWKTDWAAAEVEAKKTGRPLLIHVHAAWCGPCRRMDSDVLRTREVVEEIGAHFVAVRVDSDRSGDLVKRFRIRVLPSDLIVAADGMIASRTAGYRSVHEYLAWLRKHRAPTQTLQVSPPSEPSGTKVPAVTTPSDKPNAPPRPIGDDGLPPAATDRNLPDKPQPRVGLDGFSPVAIFHKRAWRPGKPEFAATFQGVTFHFVDAEELQTFGSKPEQYAPQLTGCDPVLLWETDRAVPGCTRHAAYFHGRLFLFVRAETLARFKQDPNRYARTRHVQRSLGGQDAQRR